MTAATVGIVLVSHSAELAAGGDIKAVVAAAEEARHVRKL